MIQILHDGVIQAFILVGVKGSQVPKYSFSLCSFDNLTANMRKHEQAQVNCLYDKIYCQALLYFSITTSSFF